MAAIEFPVGIEPRVIDEKPLRTNFVEERYELDKYFKQHLYQSKIPWGFGTFSEIIYYDKYSRRKPDGSQEHWPDSVIRVVEGCMSIRKDWYRKHGLRWEDTYWDHVAQDMADAMFLMRFLAPGRGLFAMGTEYIYERGSMALNNCAFVAIKEDLVNTMCWGMDALMCGVGVGFGIEECSFPEGKIPSSGIRVYSIPDSREGWVESVRLLLNSYFEDSPTWEFDYTKIRPKGAPLRGFGGKASGPDPLIKLHERIRDYMYKYVHGIYSRTRVCADLANAIGACVVAGNIRRSAEILLGSLNDPEFLDLKNYDKNPERAELGWMSNNSVVLRQSEEFEQLPMIAERIRDNGEPGVINMINVQKYGRIGKKMLDRAVGMNPCSEIPLESFEFCNLAEVFPMMNRNIIELWRTMELATIYASTVSLLPTHSSQSNAVIARNRRIGVSCSGLADWVDSTNLSHVHMALRDGYEKHIEPLNHRLAEEAGVPASVRLTTVKPSGTVSLLPGASPGMHWPLSTYMLRRMRMSMDSPLLPILERAGLIHEKDVYSDNTVVFAFPLKPGIGKTRSLNEVPIWEQAKMVEMLNAQWADNAVSNTLTFQPHEANQIEHVLAAFAPNIKSISMLPVANDYEQAPYEAINKEQYEAMMAKMPTLDWSTYVGDGEDPIFCNNDMCDLPTP